jgi:hypothetical protein
MEPRTPSTMGTRSVRRPAAPVSGARRIGDSAIPPAANEPAVERRALAVVAITVVAFAIVLDGPLLWVAAALLGGGVLLGARSAAQQSGPSAVGVGPSVVSWQAVVDHLAGLESGLVPAVMAAGLMLSTRLLAVDWTLLTVLVLTGLLLTWAVALEGRIGTAAAPDELRWQVVLAALVAGFVGFAGVAAMVPGGLVEPIGAGIGAATGGGAGAGGPGAAMGEADLLLLAAGDAVIAGVLGFRLVRLGPATPWEAILSGSSYAGVVALGAGLLRAMAIPQLLGPALLTLLLYLWQAFHATTPSIRRDPRWRWQVALLLVLSAVVIGWNLRLRAG